MLFEPEYWPDHPLRLGSCSWTAKGWEKAFYSPKCKAADYICEYARRYASVEIDSSFYGIPRATTLERWRDLSPPGFQFAAKCPQIITHQRMLWQCEADLREFLDAMRILRDRRGPILFQFPYFAQKSEMTLDLFVERLRDFLPLLPVEEFQYALEVRNKAWVVPPLTDLLRQHGVALALIDHPWMAQTDDLCSRPGVCTAGFTYIRWLGDRHGIERITKLWDKSVVDRTADLARWIPHIKRLLDQQVRVYGYVNNHYSGHAPADLQYLAERLPMPKLLSAEC